MKRIIALMAMVLYIISLSYGRDAQFERNELIAMKEYFNENKNDLNPIEGVYKIYPKFYYNNSLIHEINPFDIVVFEEGDDKSVFLLCYVGYENPIDHSSLPGDVIAECPGSFIMFGYIYNYPSKSNQYIFAWLGGQSDTNVIHNSFVLDIGADDFIVELFPEYNNIEYWNLPSKYKNKKLKLEIEAHKLFPLH